MEEAKEEVFRLFVERRCYAACLMASVVLRDKFETVGIRSRLVIGYLSTDNRHACRHVWLKDESGHVIDIGLAITRTYFINRGEWIPDGKRAETLPEEWELIDRDTPEEIQELTRLEELFLTCGTRKGTRRYINQLPSDSDYVKQYWRSCKKQLKATKVLNRQPQPDNNPIQDM